MSFSATEFLYLLHLCKRHNYCWVFLIHGTDIEDLGNKFYHKRKPQDSPVKTNNHLVCRATSLQPPCFNSYSNSSPTSYTVCHITTSCFHLFSQMLFLSVFLRCSSYFRPASILLASEGEKGGDSRVHFTIPLYQPAIRDRALREATQSDNGARCLIGRCCEVLLHRTSLNVRWRWILIKMDLDMTAVIWEAFSRGAVHY